MSFTGTIVRDAEVRHLSSGQSVLSVTVATNQGFKDKQTTLFIRVTLWGRRAEGQYVSFLTKGGTVFCSGELSQSEYQSQGQTKTGLELNAVILDLVGGRKDSAAPPARAPETVTDASGYDESDDIPF
ncbi:MAG: single-stranded DNA-binding protein [Candidatus Moranbacteria bacterium]|nr:single-stranded DNA-binding protein [Candidatus Moranbacteria bacterium]